MSDLAERAELDADTAAIVGVVLGTDPVPLTRAQRKVALAAMSALGYSTEYIAEQLGLGVRTVPTIASHLGVKLPRYREFVDAVAVELVAGGASMRLRGNDLAAVLPILAAQGKTITECAAQLQTDNRTVERAAAKLKLTFPTGPHDEGCWWNDYVENGFRSTRSSDDDH
jgi:hypothetical protein